jgi:Trypsin-like peptidase domain
VSEEHGKHLLELGIEFLAELLLFLYPYGADQMGLPHNFWLGLGCWVVGTAIAIRMFWIFPVGVNRWSHTLKFLVSIVFVVVLVMIFFKPIATAYHKRGPEEAVPTVAVPSSRVPSSQSQPAQAPPSSATQKHIPNKTKQVPSTQRGAVSENGSTNTAGTINQNQSQNSNAAIGNGNFQNSGNITQTTAPCSVAQIGNNNTATVNCARPSGTELAKFGAGTVVQIVSVTDGGYSNPIATGFWLDNKGYIATCLHSLPAGYSAQAFVPMPPLLGRNLTVASAGTTTDIEPVISDKETDIAILHVIQSPFERSMHGIAASQQLDERGRNIGKPESTQEQYWVPAIASNLAQNGDEVIRVAFIQKDGMPIVNYDFGHITRMGVDSSSSTRKSYRIHLSVPFKDSDCGAPIINNAKTVVGMVRGSDGVSSVAIPSSYILDVLKTIKN